MMQQLVLELAPAPAPILENFFPGPNAAAVAAVRDALSGGERVVYLWGEPGSGRTHLLRAAAAAARAQGLATLYSGAPHTELSLLGGCTALAVDDVHRLDAGAQAALFDAFNLILQNRGCLFAAGAAPVASLALRDDLRTRLGSGLSLRMLPLTDAEKAAALACHAAQRGMRLAPDIIAYVLTHCRRDMGTQIALLDALDRYSLEHKRAVTLPLLREALRALEQ